MASSHSRGTRRFAYLHKVRRTYASLTTTEKPQASLPHVNPGDGGLMTTRHGPRGNRRRSCQRCRVCMSAAPLCFRSIRCCRARGRRTMYSPCCFITLHQVISITVNTEPLLSSRAPALSHLWGICSILFRGRLRQAPALVYNYNRPLNLYNEPSCQLAPIAYPSSLYFNKQTCRSHNYSKLQSVLWLHDTRRPPSSRVSHLRQPSASMQT